MLEAVVPLLKRLEGFREKPYPDGAGRYSWGYGTLWKSVNGNTITEQKATAEMMEHLEMELRVMKSTCPRYYGTPFGVALLSKGYQYGPGIFKLYNGLSEERAVIEFNNEDDKLYSKRRIAELDLYKSLKGDNSNGLIAVGVVAFFLILISYVTFK